MKLYSCSKCETLSNICYRTANPHMDYSTYAYITLGFQAQLFARMSDTFVGLVRTKEKPHCVNCFSLMTIHTSEAIELNIREQGSLSSQMASLRSSINKFCFKHFNVPINNFDVENYSDPYIRNICLNYCEKYNIKKGEDAPHVPHLVMSKRQVDDLYEHKGIFTVDVLLWTTEDLLEFNSLFPLKK